MKILKQEEKLAEKSKVPASFDAKDWAEEFNNVLVRRGEQPYDPGWLIGWFANALMRGHDEGVKRTKEEISNPTRSQSHE